MGQLVDGAWTDANVLTNHDATGLYYKRPSVFRSRVEADPKAEFPAASGRYHLYCAVACPYQARYKTNKALFAYGSATASEAQRHDSGRLAVATKCTFCVDRIDAGIERGMTPGIDPEATPACVNACIANALAFGDLDDPRSNVSTLLAGNRHFRMHEELGTGPGFYYLWDKALA